MLVRAVRVERTAPRELAHKVLADAVAWFLRGDADRPAAPADVVIGHHCPWCAASDHGRPVAALADRESPAVSVSRAGGLVVVAVGHAAAVGVDVEPDDAASFPGFAGVALHPGELVADRGPDRTARQRTRIWVRKEAVLKALGTGLRLDARALRVSGPDDPPAVLGIDAAAAPGNLGTTQQPIWLDDLDLAPGYLVSLAVVGPRRPEVVLQPAARP